MSSNISVEDNKIMVLADFDDTLINCDSMVTILKKEKWYLNCRIICAGLGIIAAKLTKGDVLKKRSQLKYLMLEKYDGLSVDKIDEYVKYFASRINRNVIDKINSLNPDKIIIASASSKELIVKVLEGVLRVDIVIANSIREDEADNIGTLGADNMEPLGTDNIGSLGADNADVNDSTKIEDNAICTSPVKTKEKVVYVDSEKNGKNTNKGTKITINEFKTCYGEEKARRFCAEIKDYAEHEIYVFSDSLSDMPIFKLGKECYLVEGGEFKALEL